jgi:hypothetical protein
MQKLQFTKVDLGNFDFHDWEENRTFTGSYEDTWVGPDHGGSNPVSGVSMFDFETGARINLGTSYQITKFFDNEAENEVDFKKTIYRITHLGQLELKGGKSVNKFQFEKAEITTADEKPTETPEETPKAKK